MKHQYRNAAFTLVEISIVLVIIGLLAGGIVVGRSLIRQSQINSVMVDAQRYINAVLAFKQKYSALPGDFAQATNYWGAQSGCSLTGYGGASQGALTCNGNGDGQITNGPEDVYAWQHLSDAGLIQGTYTGIPGPSGKYDNVLGTNVPTSSVDGAGFGIFWIGTQTTASTYNFPGTYTHALIFGRRLSNNPPASPVFTGAESLAFDTKYDDGIPSTGNITIWLPSYLNSTCASSSTASTAQYVITGSGPTCSFILSTNF